MCVSVRVGVHLRVSACVVCICACVLYVRLQGLFRKFADEGFFLPKARRGGVVSKVRGLVLLHGQTVVYGYINCISNALYMYG